MRNIAVLGLLVATLFAEEPDAVALLGWEEGRGATRTAAVLSPPGRVVMPEGARYAEFPFGRKLKLRLAVWRTGFAADIDFDGDLAEEKRYAWGRVRVRVPAPDEAARVAMLIMRRSADKVALTPLHVRAGDVVVGGQLRRAVWTDRDADWIAETLQLDFDGDGTLGKSERLMVGNIAVLGSRKYRLDTEGFCGRDVLFTDVGPGPKQADGDVLRRQRALALAETVGSSPAAAPGPAAAGKAARLLALAGDTAAIKGCVALLPVLAAGAVPQLAHVRNPGGINVLRGALRHRDPRVRRAAADALSGVDDDKVAAALVKQLEREKDPGVREALSRATRGLVEPARLRTLARGGLEALPKLRAAGLHQGPVRRALLRLLRDRDAKIKITALDLLGPHRYRDLLAGTAHCLTDRDWRVRAAAAEALGRVRVRASVRVLIERLAREKHARVRQIIGDELHRLTAENLRDFEKIWRKWWARNGETFVVAPRQPVKRKPHKGERRTVSTFFGVDLVDKAVVFVIDKSASMSQGAADGVHSRWGACLEELETAIAGLPPGARFDVVTFDTNVWRWQGKLVPAKGSNVEAVIEALKKKRPSGGTYLFEGLQEALSIEGVETIYLLSDGKPSGTVSKPDEIIKRTLALNRFRRAVIHCIAVGYASPWLRRLARATRGTYSQR